MPDIQYLKLLAEKYPNRKAVRTEIINLRAILALPKATEFFFSDIHGEFDAFQYFVRSGSGMIRMRMPIATTPASSRKLPDIKAPATYTSHAPGQRGIRLLQPGWGPFPLPEG